MTYTRVLFRGKRLNTRTRDMVLAAEKLLGYQLQIFQGSYNAGGVSASAGTHDGGGAVDVWGKSLSDATTVANTMRRVGFAAWVRTPQQGNWGYHVHAIAIDDAELSSGARAQVVDYKAGRNGLANNGRDTFSRAYVNMTWEDYKADLSKTVVHRSVIQYGANGGYFHSGQQAALAEVRLFVRWCNRLDVASDKDMRVWETFIRQGNWKSAGLQLTGIIRALQHRYKKPADGVFGPVTGEIMAHDGYRVVA